MFSVRAEERAQKLVAIQFFLLAPDVAVESLRSLIGAEHVASARAAASSPVRRRRPTASARTSSGSISWGWPSIFGRRPRLTSSAVRRELEVDELGLEQRLRCAVGRDHQTAGYEQRR